jgi:hypothetical protein
LYSFASITNASQAYVRIPFSDLLPSPTANSLLVLDNTYSPALPLPIKLGDANLDGFPDLLFIVFNPSDGSQTPKLLFSEPCAKGLGGCDEKGQGRRGFQLITKGAETLEAVKDARGVAFLDMDEDVGIEMSQNGAYGLTVCRVRWILSCNAMGAKGKAVSCSSRTTFTMMHSS